MQILEDRIIWDREDFLTGFIPDPSSSYRFNEVGAANMTNIDVFSISPGLLTVGSTPTSVGTVNTTALVDATFDPTTVKSYLLGAQLHRFDATADALDKDADWPHTISYLGLTGGGTLGQTVFYHTSGSAKVVFYSFQVGTTTGGMIGTHEIGTTAFDEDFMATVPTSGTLRLAQNRMLPLCVTSDDRLLFGDYISDQGKVHSYNGAANTVSQNVLNLPFNFEPVGIVEEENGFDTVVFATTARAGNRRGSSKAFWWSVDRPASWYKASPIPDDECAAPFAAFGTVGCFTRARTSSGSGSGNTSVLRIFEDGQWVPKYHWSGSLPAVGGVDIQDNTVVWNSDGLQYRWGPKWGKYPVAVFQERSGGGTSSGMLKSLSNATTTAKLYMSSGSGASGLQKFSNFGTGSWQGSSAAPKFPFGKKGKVVGVQIHLFGGAAGGGRTLKLDLMDEAFGGQTVFTDVFGVYTATDGIKKYLPESFANRVVEFSAIAPLLTWQTGSGATNATSVERVEVFYETVDINNP